MSIKINRPKRYWSGILGKFVTDEEWEEGIANMCPDKPGAKNGWHQKKAGVKKRKPCKRKKSSKGCA